MKTFYILAGTLALWSVVPSAPVGEVPSPTPVAAAEVAKSATLTVDPSRSTLNWTAKKVGGEHSGTVKIASGTLEVKSNRLVGGTFAMDMTTITDTDITNEGMNAKLTNHLKSEDFFSVEKHPKSTFTLTKVAPIAKAQAGQPNYTVTGNLTIKGITHPVTFPAVVKLSGDNAEATAKFDIDRTKWDIKYRAAIIGTAADKIIDDNFTIDLKIAAGKSAANS
ncbi:MAG: YceI family protein [Cytophagales bacterium]|nr:YceI family protein [Cytophagales bacterium]